jgi:hypothetical protein
MIGDIRDADVRFSFVYRVTGVITVEFADLLWS